MTERKRERRRSAGFAAPTPPVRPCCAPGAKPAARGRGAVYSAGSVAPLPLSFAAELCHSFLALRALTVDLHAPHRCFCFHRVQSCEFAFRIMSDTEAPAADEASSGTVGVTVTDSTTHFGEEMEARSELWREEINEENRVDMAIQLGCELLDAAVLNEGWKHSPRLSRTVGSRVWEQMKPLRTKKNRMLYSYRIQFAIGDESGSLSVDDGISFLKDLLLTADKTVQKTWCKTFKIALTAEHLSPTSDVTYLKFKEKYKVAGITLKKVKHDFFVLRTTKVLPFFDMYGQMREAFILGMRSVRHPQAATEKNAYASDLGPSGIVFVPDIDPDAGIIRYVCRVVLNMTMGDRRVEDKIARRLVFDRLRECVQRLENVFGNGSPSPKHASRFSRNTDNGLFECMRMSRGVYLRWRNDELGPGRGKTKFTVRSRRDDTGKGAPATSAPSPSRSRRRGSSASLTAHEVPEGGESAHGPQQHGWGRGSAASLGSLSSSGSTVIGDDMIASAEDVRGTDGRISMESG